MSSFEPETDPVCAAANWHPAVGGRNVLYRPPQASNDANATYNVDLFDKARYLDNLIIEPLCRSLKFGGVYLHALDCGSQAKAGVGTGSPSITIKDHVLPKADIRPPWSNSHASEPISRNRAVASGCCRSPRLNECRGNGDEGFEAMVCFAGSHGYLFVFFHLAGVVFNQVSRFVGFLVELRRTTPIGSGDHGVFEIGVGG